MLIALEMFPCQRKKSLCDRNYLNWRLPNVKILMLLMDLHVKGAY